MPQRSKTLYFIALFWALCVFVLLMAGGLVTSHDAGLSVPDWPLSYGQWMPPMVGNIFWEHGHRMIAAFVGLLTLIAACMIQIMERRTWLKKLAWIALGMVILQGLLGGLTVLLLLPPAVSIAHACLAQTYFCVVIAIAYYLSSRSSRSSENGSAEELAPLRRVSLMTFAVIYIQLILGAAVRHTGHAVIVHILFALVVVIHVLLLIGKLNHLEGRKMWLIAPAAWLGGLTLLQIFLGIGSLVFTKMVERSYAPSQAEVAFTAAHHSNGALVLGLAALLFFMIRPAPPEQAPVPPAQSSAAGV